MRNCWKENDASSAMNQWWSWVGTLTITIIFHIQNSNLVTLNLWIVWSKIGCSMDWNYSNRWCYHSIEVCEFLSSSPSSFFLCSIRFRLMWNVMHLLFYYGYSSVLWMLLASFQRLTDALHGNLSDKFIQIIDEYAILLLFILFTSRFSVSSLILTTRSSVFGMYYK